MGTFEPAKEILACYAALAKKEKGCIKRAQKMLDYLSTQEKSAWAATVKRLNREVRENKRVMPKKDW